MSTVQLLVSLLPAEESEQLLRSIHRSLPPGRASSIALLRPPEPGMGVAALRGSAGVLTIATASGHAFAAAGERAGIRRFVWCRADAEAEALPAEAGTALVAESIEELAWELVRRLTGDLRESRAEPRGLVAVQHGLPESRGIDTAPAAPEASAPPGRRQGRLPAPPSWAQGVPAGAFDQGRAMASPDHGVRNSALESAPPVAPAPPLPDRVDVASLPPTPPLTPLAALAQLERIPPVGADVVPARNTASAGAISHAPRGQTWSQVHRIRRLIGRTRLRGGPDISTELSPLGQALLRGHSTLVVVGTPKGGPGKTTEAAALGVLGARAVEPHGGSAVLVDANLNNPDSWRQLAVPSDAITVREVIDALNRGALVPNGEFAHTERLRVLPERRSAGSAYSAAEISRLAQHLRVRHTLIVVDLPNSLPGLGEGPKEALVAHWLQHSDVVVLPIDLGEASFIAAGEILDAIEKTVGASQGRLRMPGLVVPLLLPPGGRRAIEIPAIAELLDHLRAAGADIVEVPFTVEVQTASHRRSPIVGASARTDRAFVGVLRAVVAARRTGEERSRA